MFVCTHGHTQPQPFMCHGLTKSNRTHKQYTLECDTVWVPVVANVLTFFLTSFFFLSSSFLFFSSLIWARRCFLRSSSAFRSLLSDMVSYGASRKRTEQEWAAYGTDTICSGFTVTWYSTEEYKFIQWAFSDASKNPLGVAIIHSCTVDL